MLCAQIAVGRGKFGLDLRPVGLELLGDDHRQGGEAALAHLGARIADDDRVVGLDHEPGIDLVRGRLLRAPRLRPRSRLAAWAGPMPIARPPAAVSAVTMKLAARQCRRERCFRPWRPPQAFISAAARWIARADPRIGAAAADIGDAGVDIGVGRLRVSASGSAAAAMICPDWQ